MKDRDRLFLGHVLEAIAAIESFTAEGRTYFMADLKTQSAVVRQIEIIGEAIKNLDPALLVSEPAVPWRQIAGTRDRLFTGISKSTSTQSGRWSSRISRRSRRTFGACSA